MLYALMKASPVEQGVRIEGSKFCSQLQICTNRSGFCVPGASASRQRANDAPACLPPSHYSKVLEEAQRASQELLTGDFSRSTNCIRIGPQGLKELRTARLTCLSLIAPCPPRV
jgi:hypothetical protein